MKKLPKAIFSGAPSWVKSAAINADGEIYWHNASKCQLSQTHDGYFVNTRTVRRSKFVGKSYDTSDWQNSAIDREYK